MVSQSTHDDGPRVGSLLRASRLRCGEEVVDVANVLHIRLVYITAIEEGRYDDLPGVAYAVGFIRAYAEHLGLDSEEVVRRFKAETSGLDVPTDLKFLSPIPESGIPRGAILFVGMVVAVLAYGGWYVSSTRDHFLTDLIPSLPERLAALLPADDATDAKAPPALPGPDAAVAGEAPRPESAMDIGAVDSAAPAGSTPTVNAEAVPMVIPQTVTASAEPEPADRAVETAPPIAVAPAPEIAEMIEPSPPEETPVAETAPISPSLPAPADSVPAATTVTATTVTHAIVTDTAVTDATETDTTVTDTVATIIPSAPEATPEPQPAPPTVTELVEATVPATPDRNAEPATGDLSSAVAAPPPEVAKAVDGLQQPAPPAAPETMTSPAPTVEVEQPDPASDGVTTTDAPPPAATGGEDGDQVAALIEDTEPKPVAAATPAAEEGPSRILVRARMASWIQVRDDVGNQLLMTRLMRPGDTFRVPDRPGLTLLTGNAGALEILVDGETMPPLGPIGAVRRDVTLDIERLRKGTAAIE